MVRLFSLMALMAFAAHAAAVGPIVGPDCRFSWPAVTTNTQGNTITVDGYRLYVYETAGGFSSSLDPADEVTSLQTTCSAAGVIDPGQYYARVTAFDAGLESAPSPEVPFVLADVTEPPPEDDPLVHLTLDNTFGVATGRSVTFTTTSTAVAVGTHASVLNATTDAIIVPTAGMSPLQGCVLMWARPTLQDANGRNPFSHTSLATGYDDRLQLRTVNTTVSMRLGSSTTDTVLGTMPLNQYRHLGLSWDHGTAHGYVDGVRTATRAYTGVDTLKSYLHVGNSGTDNAAFAFIGNIDDVRLYDQPCTEAQVHAVYLDR